MTLDQINLELTAVRVRMQAVVDRLGSMAVAGAAYPGNPSYDTLDAAREAYLKRAQELVAEAEKLVGIVPDKPAAD